MLEEINKWYNEYATANSLPVRTFAYHTGSNSIYIINSDTDPLHNSSQKIELIITDNNNNGYGIVIDKDEKDGWYNQWLLYSTQSISFCDSNPIEPIEKTICSNHMIGYDLQKRPTDFYFHGVQNSSTSTDEKIPTAVIATETWAIQSFLNTIFGTNKVIWYLNSDNTITVRYDRTIDTNNILFLVGNETDIKDKIQALDNTTHNLCSTTIPQPVLATEATCTPNTVNNSGQSITCTFTITNNGSGNANKLTYNGITLPKGFVVSGEGSWSTVDLLPGESVQYTVIGNQTILPSKWSEMLIIGDLIANYEDPINGKSNLSLQTSIQVSAIPDTSAPTAPTINSIGWDNNSPYITNHTTPTIVWTAESWSLITVTISGVVYTGFADQSWNYNITINPPLLSSTDLILLISLQQTLPETQVWLIQWCLL